MSHTTTRTRALALAAAAATLGGVTTATFAGSAEALPPSQKACNFATGSIAVADGWQPLGMGVTIDNGTAARQVVAQMSADVGVDSDAEVRVGYSIDNGPVQERVFGPANFANHDEFWETRSTLAVIPLGAGSHTVKPYWRISGSAGKQGYFQTGCFVVEGRTR